MTQSNSQAIKGIHAQQQRDKITKKEIFTRIIRLEEKMDQMWSDHRRAASQAKSYFYGLFALVTFHIFLTILLAYLEKYV